YQFAMLEKHPLGSQAFVPLAPFVFLVVVAPPGEAPQDIRAFASNGQQGISYHRGTWHMPLIALETGQSFLVIDREGSTLQTNLETFYLDRPLLLGADL
ncbi:MAG: ureidoglycolate lyase, partial [Gammaproteobacteria bacterium]|nr:ureidoglycolate lyase [Gammaproteobacteria bacterium]